MNKRYIVDLTADERANLLALLGKGVALARKLMVALWRYLETGLVPTGAAMRPSL